jgi:hypothetical protein
MDHHAGGTEVSMSPKGTSPKGTSPTDSRSATSPSANGAPSSRRNPMWSSAGYGVAPTPWQAVQIAAWAVVKRGEAAGAIERR